MPWSIVAAALVPSYCLSKRRQELAVYRAEGEKNLARLYALGEGQASKKTHTHNCRNCGAPPEPVCSYCGTKA